MVLGRGSWVQAVGVGVDVSNITNSISSRKRYCYVYL